MDPTDPIVDAAVRALKKRQAQFAGALTSGLGIDADEFEASLREVVRERLSTVAVKATPLPAAVEPPQDKRPVIAPTKRPTSPRGGSPTKLQVAVLQVIVEAGGAIKPRAIYDRLVERGDITPVEASQVSRAMHLVNPMVGYGWLEKLGESGAVTIRLLPAGEEAYKRAIVEAT